MEVVTFLNCDTIMWFVTQSFTVCQDQIVVNLYRGILKYSYLYIFFSELSKFVL